MKKVLGYLQALIKVVLALAIAVCAWFFLTPYFRVGRNTEGDLYRNMPEQTLDVLCLGSSHMQYAFNPAVFYAETGLYSYVMGSACQPITITYSLLEESLKTQSPEVVLVDVFTLLPQSEVCYAYGAYYLAIDEMTGETRYKAADAVPEGEYKLSYKFDLLMNHDNWKTMDFTNLEEIMANVKPAEGYNYNQGYVPLEPEKQIFTPLWVPEVTEEYKLSDEDKQSLDNIIDLCQEAGARIIFIKTPYQINDEDMNKLQAIWNYLDSRNIQYVDYIRKAEELGWFMDMDGDTWHNNTWGAEIITTDLANMFKENGYVKNHRENSTWEDLLAFSVRATTYHLMGPSNIDVYRLLKEAQTYPCLVLVNYVGRPNTSIGEEENALLQSVGFTKDVAHDPSTDYYAVVKDGKLVQESTTPFEYDLNGTIITFGEKGILFDGEHYDTTGQMDLYFLAEDLQWINAIPIDYATRWFWKKTCDGWTCEY